MSMFVSRRLRAVSSGTTVSTGGDVSTSVAEIVSGVSPLGRPSGSNERRVDVYGARVRRPSQRTFVFGLAPLACGLSLWVTSCAEPRLDGLPEDPGHNPPPNPLPTIGPPVGGTDLQPDASVAPNDTTDDASETPSEIVAPGRGDAGGPGSSHATGTTATTGTPTQATSTGGSGSNAPMSSGTSTSPSESNDTTDGDEADAGAFYDAGIDMPVEPDAGDAGDGSVDSGLDAGAEP